MQRKRNLILVFLALALVLSFGAVSAQDEGAVFKGAWPYTEPPQGHFNQFATGRIDLGIYYDLMFPPLAFYHWGSGEYEGILADSFGFDEDNNYVVTLKSGSMWSDGTPVTAQDIVTTFNVFYLTSHQAWNSISGVEAVDDLTARFTVTAPSAALERLILVENTQPTSVYGDFAGRAQELITAGTKAGEAAFDDLLAELTAFRPDPIGNTFVIDPDSITAGNLMLVKNPDGFNADVVRFDTIQVSNGETEAVTPLVANSDVWYATHGFPPATEASFVEQGVEIIRHPGYSGPAIYVNHEDPILSRVEVRQAIAYAINREENGFVSLGESGVAVEYMTGMSDSLAESFLSEDVLNSLNTYDYDPDAGAALLEGIGFTKGDDGVWMDDQGNRLAFELKFPAEFADWSAAAENATQALNDFGFEITGSAVQFQQQEQEVYDSNFQMAIRNWGTSSPFPSNSYREPYNRYNGQGLLAGEETGGGMNFNMDVTYSGGEVNVFDATIAAGQGLDVEAQNALIQQLAVSYNELLPAIPLWERYGNNPFHREFLDAPAGDEESVAVNPWSGNDAFIPYWILTGAMGPGGM
jgi:peptide/nickel transport system substrate-binding protein